MMYALVGTDRDARQKSLAGVLAAHAERDALYFDSESFDESLFMNAVAGGDMFGKQYVAVLRGLISGDRGPFVRLRLAEMAGSSTVFVVIEESLSKALSDEVKEHANEYRVLDLPKGRDEHFNIFQITDAFGTRDKKSTWVLLQKALRSDIAAEEVLNILIWQAKNLLVAYRSASVAASGLAPFVYEKSKRYSRNFKEEELKDISRNLVRMFHESHLGLDLGPNLERFLLKTL